MELITRTNALEAGLKYYVTGLPCKNNHLSKRLVSNGTCYQCILNRNKLHVINNKEKVAKYKSDWYHANKDLCKDRSKKYAEDNKETVKARNKAYRDRQSVRVKTFKRLNRYGLSVEAHEALLIKYDNKCQICKSPETGRHQNGKIKNLSVDHCHQTGKVRGLLCQSCNRGLGSFRDSIESLEAAIEYLKS